MQTPWRTATARRGGVAAFEFVVLIVLLVALLAEPVSQHVAKAAEGRCSRPWRRSQAGRDEGALAAAPGSPARETSVIVLNGNGRSGAAARWPSACAAKGYTIGGVGNAPRADFPRTVVMYRSGFEAEGKRLAKDLRRQDRRPARRPEALGADRRARRRRPRRLALNSSPRSTCVARAVERSAGEPAGRARVERVRLVQVHVGLAERADVVLVEAERMPRVGVLGLQPNGLGVRLAARRLRRRGALRRRPP